MTSFIRRSSAVLAAILMIGGTVPALAQDPAVAQENIDLFVGDIFEIIPSHGLPDATYTWILTQDRTFIEAGRAQTFRKRLITPGRYTLYAEISGGGQNLSRTFVLDYKARVPGQQPVTATGSAGALVRTSPASDEQGRAVLAESSQLIRLDPVNPDMRPIVADLDLTRDTNADGDPQNDIDTELTFFQSDATPLYVWIPESITSRPMSVIAARPEGAVQQRIEVYSEAYAREQGITRTPSQVTIERTGNRTYTFSAGFPANIPAQTPLLYHWEFGDGQQSLLANPVHEYASEGAYEVKLRIRNLTDGREIASYTEEITVESDGAPAEPTEEPAEEEPVTEPSGSGVGIGSILLFAGIFIASILFGIGIIVLLSKLRGRGKSLSDTIEKMEQAVVKKDDAGNPPTLTIAPPPQAPKQQTPPPSIAEREKDKATSNPAQQRTPAVEEKNAPAWLKSGLTGQPAPAAPAQPAPAAPSQPKPQTPPPAPQQPKPSTPPSAPAPQQRPQSTPPWLQQTAPAPQAGNPAATPTPSPAPQQPKPVVPPVQSAPAPQQPQTPPPAPAPQQAPQPRQTAANQLQSVPAWLQTPPAAAQQSAPAPSQPPVPAPAPQAATPPAPAQAPAAPAQPSVPQQSAPAPQSDTPVAFIRADSLDAQKPQNGQNPPPQSA